MLHLRVLSVLLIALLLSSCATLSPDFEEPDLQLTNLQLLPIKGLEQRIRLSFRLVNPNNVSFPIQGLSFKLNLQGVKVASGVTNKAFVLQPLGESTFDVDVSTDLLNSGRVLLDMMNSKPQELAYQIDAKIFTSKGIWGSIPVTRNGVIPFALNSRSN